MPSKSHFHFHKEPWSLSKLIFSVERINTAQDTGFPYTLTLVFDLPIRQKLSTGITEWHFLLSLFFKFKSTFTTPTNFIRWGYRQTSLNVVPRQHCIDGPFLNNTEHLTDNSTTSPHPSHSWARKCVLTESLQSSSLYEIHSNHISSWKMSSLSSTLQCKWRLKYL